MLSMLMTSCSDVSPNLEKYNVRVSLHMRPVSVLLLCTKWGDHVTVLYCTICVIKGNKGKQPVVGALMLLYQTH